MICDNEETGYMYFYETLENLEFLSEECIKIASKSKEVNIKI